MLRRKRRARRAQYRCETLQLFKGLNCRRESGHYRSSVGMCVTQCPLTSDPPCDNGRDSSGDYTADLMTCTRDAPRNNCRSLRANQIELLSRQFTYTPIQYVPPPALFCPEDLLQSFLPLRSTAEKGEMVAVLF